MSAEQRFGFGLTREHVETLMGPYSSVFTDPREVVAA